MFGGIGKLVGGALNAVGLGKLAPFVSMGINFFTGNYAGLVTDVMGLMSNIKGLGFMNKVAQFAPVGNFANLSNPGNFDCFSKGGGLKLDRLLDIGRNFRDLSDSVRTYRASAKKVQNMMEVVRETLDNRQVVQAARDNAYYNGTARYNA
ncbi:MAG TPA: hypothetical protein VNA19_11650 [Pyrinomonadaceae bacterium]|jgi:hypothetical protein|nr:hypothetical protein [Pyrinomonadaceae bacterium]